MSYFYLLTYFSFRSILHDLRIGKRIVLGHVNGHEILSSQLNQPMRLSSLLINAKSSFAIDILDTLKFPKFFQAHPRISLSPFECESCQLVNTIMLPTHVFIFSPRIKLFK